MRLTLTDGSGKVVSVNSYYLSTKPDVLSKKEDDKDDWNITWCESFADFTALQSLPKVDLAIEKLGVRQFKEEEETRVRVKNQSNAIALLVRAKLSRDSVNGEEVLPVRWEDNYFMLLPGEERVIAARYLLKDSSGQKLYASVDCFNNGRG